MGDQSKLTADQVEAALRLWIRRILVGEPWNMGAMVATKYIEQHESKLLDAMREAVGKFVADEDWWRGCRPS